MSDWPELTLTREAGSESVEMLSPGKEAKSAGWEYEDYVPGETLAGVEGERDYWKSVADALLEARGRS